MNKTEELLNNYKLEGTELAIFKYPSAVLKKVATDVTKFDDELHTLCKNMLFTMYSAPGIGLAAPQIGKSLRIFVIDTNYKREEITLADESIEYRPHSFKPQIFINPVIKEKEGEILYEEGCLSLPDVYEEVKRAESIVLEYYDLDGNKQALAAKETLAVCIQHENDHLDGIVFIDRLSLLKRNLLRKKFLKKKKKML